MKKPLREQVPVVAGASSGIGRAVARAAGERGAKVVVSARNAEALEAVWETLAGDAGAHGRFDASSRGSSAWTEARRRLGKMGSIAAVTGSLLAGLIGYHRVTRRR